MKQTQNRTTKNCIQIRKTLTSRAPGKLSLNLRTDEFFGGATYGFVFISSRYIYVVNVLASSTAVHTTFSTWMENTIWQRFYQTVEPIWNMAQYSQPKTSAGNFHCKWREKLIWMRACESTAVSFIKILKRTSSSTLEIAVVENVQL